MVVLGDGKKDGTEVKREMGVRSDTFMLCSKFKGKLIIVDEITRARSLNRLTKST